MTQFPVSTSSERSIHAALELSKNSWLLAIQVPGRDNPSRYPNGSCTPHCGKPDRSCRI